MTWNGIVYFLRGDDGDYHNLEWDSLFFEGGQLGLS